MAETSYPVAGGGSVTDAAYEKLMAEISGSGFLGSPTASSVMYGDSTGRQVKLAASRAAVLRGFRWETDGSGLTVPVAANTSGQPRLDLGVLRLSRTDPNAWTVRFALKQGSPAASPTAPAVTQSTAADGVWEIPVGTVRVISTTLTQANAGQPSITAADVAGLDYYIAPPPLVCHSSKMPTTGPGDIVTQYDTGKTYVRLASSYHLIGENGAATNLTPASGWRSGQIWATRRNGFTHLQGIWVRDSPTTVAAEQDLTVCTIPAQYRPERNVYLNGSHGQYHARLHINATTGVLLFMGSTRPVAEGESIWVHPQTYPSV